MDICSMFFTVYNIHKRLFRLFFGYLKLIVHSFNKHICIGICNNSVNGLKLQCRTVKIYNFSKCISCGMIWKIFFRIVTFQLFIKFFRRSQRVITVTHSIEKYVAATVFPTEFFRISEHVKRTDNFRAFLLIN